MRVGYGFFSQIVVSAPWVPLLRFCRRQCFELYRTLCKFARECFTNVLRIMAQIVTIKAVIIPAQQRSDKSFNVKIRVTYKRKYRIISTNLTAFPRDIARSGELKGEPLVKADELIAKMYQVVGEIDYFSMEEMDVDDVVSEIKRKLQKKDRFSLDFFEYAERVMEKKGAGTRTTYVTALNSFRRYLGRDSYDINEFDAATLKAFVDYVDTSPKFVVPRKEKESAQPKKKRAASSGKEEKPAAAPKPKKRGISSKNYVGKLAYIYREAMAEYNDEDAGIIRIPKDPFKKVKLSSEQSVARISRSPEFIQKIIDSRGNTSGEMRVALDIYLISFALMGANTADLLTMAPDKDGVITYYRQKTRSRRADNAEMKVRIEPCVKPLIDRYRNPSQKTMFSFPMDFKDKDALSASLTYFLSKWADLNGEENLTMYSARHSWATIGRSNRVGLSKSVIDECLAHATNQLVDVYAEKDWSILWEANAKVLKIFDWTNI